MTPKEQALTHLRTMLNPQADFRPGQWEAIEAVAIHKKRALVVQRTEWGKSQVYFLATKLMREQGSGPTLLISHLISLMRNRLIYCLADYAFVVASGAETGSTWAGATETLKNAWVPVFVLEHAQMPDGNKLLLQKGARPFLHPFRETSLKLVAWLAEKAAQLPKALRQLGLF